VAVLAENRAKLQFTASALRGSTTGIMRAIQQATPDMGNTLGTGADFYFSGPAEPLRQHGGILFPYQPDITYSVQASYNPYDLVHTNYTYYAYRNTPSPTIQLNTQFASVTQEEGEYTLGVLHFLRSITKMFFGLNERSNPMAGTPPPVLRFSAFGETQFNNLPVLVDNFSTTYDSNVDLKDVNGVQIPVIMNIFISLLVQINPDKQKNEYSTDAFIKGDMYRGGFI